MARTTISCAAASACTAFKQSLIQPELSVMQSRSGDAIRLELGEAEFPTYPCHAMIELDRDGAEKLHGALVVFLGKEEGA